MPDKAGKLGNGGLRIKPVNVADFSDDAGGVNLANARNGSQGIGDDFKLLLNGLVQNLDLLFQGPHRGNGDRHGLIHGVIYRFGQTIGALGSSSHRFGCGSWICKSSTSCFCNEGGQFFQIRVCQIIHCFKALHESNRGGAGISNILILGHAGAFEKQVVGKPLFFTSQILNDLKSGPRQGLECFVTVIIHVDLPGDSAKTQMVGNHKGVHPVVLRQVRIGFLEFPHLLGVKDMNLSLELPQSAIFSESVDKAVPVDRGGLQTDHNITELHGAECRYDSF